MDDYRADVKAVMDDLLLPIPGVSGGQSFGYPAYKANGKVFAFVGGAGIGLKLTPERVAELVASGGGFAPFEPVSGTVWKAWVSLDLSDADAYRAHEGLLHEALAVVGGG